MISRILLVAFSAALILTQHVALAARGEWFEVTYEPSTEPGQLQLRSTYTVWIPEGVKQLRGVIVHQHGCGKDACLSGALSPYDLHWQELAKKWDCALLGPFYHQLDKEECRLWCDPRNGSEQTFLRALADLGGQARHPELKTVPWAIWGHSGGAFWTSLMQVKFPDRIVAIWLRSGSAFSTWEKGEIPKPEIPEAAYQVPVISNPGTKEAGVIKAAYAQFEAYRAQGAPFGIAIDPRTGHECGDSRYLAIPFFDECLALRLPDKGSTDQKLKAIDQTKAWLVARDSQDPKAASEFSGDPWQSLWLPSERIAKLWSEYVRTGATSDTTPPPAPSAVKIGKNDTGDVEITWQADADFESGLQAFAILRDGKELAQLPQNPTSKFGRPIFQKMSYHDTPSKPFPEMRYVDQGVPAGEKHEYRVIAINTVGLRSEPSAVAR